MFLSKLKSRNPDFLEIVIGLHQNGKIPANCTVIDVSSVETNSRFIKDRADELDLSVLAMTKQFGRNPDAIQAIVRGGVTSAVAVDLECAHFSVAGGLQLGHIGHLVQIPSNSTHSAAQLSPSQWTVFNMDKAAEISAVMSQTGGTQKVTVRINRPGDFFYRGHGGGFDVESVCEVADAIDEMPGLNFAGVTTFPALLFNRDKGQIEPTPNLSTLEHARTLLESSGRSDFIVNAPGTTSASTLALLADHGATQVEPGHGFTGTTPLHATQDLVEKPSMVYVTEISHVWGGDAYIFGGGFYVDPVLGLSAVRALLVPRGGSLEDAKEIEVDMPSPESIDYYATTKTGDVVPRPGDTVLFGFRQQVFVSRSLTVGLSTSGKVPHLGELHYANGSLCTDAYSVATQDQDDPHKGEQKR